MSIGLLARVFPAEVVDAAVDACGVREKLNRQLPARLMVYFMLACWLWSDRGYVRVLRELVDGLRWAHGGWDGWRLPYDGSIAKARVRLGDGVMAELFATVRGPLGAADSLWRGLRVCAIDGTVFDLERTAENLAAYTVPTDGYFPQLRAVVLAECASLAVIDAACDAVAIGERELAGRLLGSLAPRMLVLADRGFPGVELMRQVADTGAHLAWRVQSSFKLTPTHRLPDGTYLTELRRTRWSDPLTVRVIEFSVRDDQDGISEVFALATTLIDHEWYPAGEIAGLYARRWRAETLIKLLKVHVRTTHATFRSKSPAMVRQEFYALLCCYQAISQVAGQAAGAAEIDPGDISFPTLADAVRRSVATALSPLQPR